MRILSHRLLVRDAARLEHDTPGITTAIRAAIDRAQPPRAPERPQLNGPSQRTCTAPLPDAAQLEDLNALMGELRSALAATREPA